MAKHTPESWQIQDFSLSWLRIVAEDGVTTICELPFLKEAHFAEVRAHARLIKVSPIMLEELRDCLCILEANYLEPKHQDSIRTVIRKAEGETDE